MLYEVITDCSVVEDAFVDVVALEVSEQGYGVVLGTQDAAGQGNDLVV